MGTARLWGWGQGAWIRLTGHVPVTLACPQVQVRSQGNSYAQVQGERRGRDSCEPPGEEYTCLGVIEGHLAALTLGVLAPQTLQASEEARGDASERGPGGKRGHQQEGTGPRGGLGHGGRPGHCSSEPPRGPGLRPCPAMALAASWQPGLYVNQGLISPSSVCVEYHFFNYRRWAGWALCVVGPITINRRVTIRHVGARCRRPHCYNYARARVNWPI